MLQPPTRAGTERLVETSFDIALVSSVELEEMVTDAWRTGRHGSSPLYLGWREIKTRASRELEMKKKRENQVILRVEGERILGCGTEKKGKWKI